MTNNNAFPDTLLKSNSKYHAIPEKQANPKTNAKGKYLYFLLTVLGGASGGLSLEPVLRSTRRQ